MTLQEVGAIAFILALTIGVIVLVGLGAEVPVELMAAFTAGAFYILGSRTSTPKVSPPKEESDARTP